MNKTIRKIHPTLLLPIPFLLLFSVYFFTQGSNFIEFSDTISSYLILDLLLTIPFVYFLIVRKTKVPNATVVPMIFLGLLLGYYTIPVDQHYYLDLFKSYGLPVIEMIVFATVVFNVRRGIRSFKANNKGGVDFYNVLQTTCQELIPGRMSSLLVSEISVIYYGFINWEKPRFEENEFTYHKKSGSQALFGALIFIVLIETIAIHIVLMQWSHLAAMILSVLSVYTGLQFLGFGRSLSKRPISIDNGALYLRYGILNETTIKIGDIESVELSRKSLEYDDEVRKLSMLGDLESHNVVIRCKNTQKMEGIYGINKSYSTLTLFVDDKEKFKNTIDELLTH